MTSQENTQLYLQLDRDIGMLIAMLSDVRLNTADLKIVYDITMRMDEAMPKLQGILYPDSQNGSKI